MIGRALFILAAAGAVLAGCRGGFSQRAEGRSEATLRIALASNPTTLDPGRVQDIDAGDLLANVFEGLVAYDAENRLVGQLAEDFRWSPDGRTVTFSIRAAKFHDGREVTAEDVKATWERNLSPAFASPTADYLADIVGAREVMDGRAKGLAGVKVLGPRKLSVEIRKPMGAFLGKLTYPVAAVLPKDIPDFSPENLAAGKLVGTGPFRFRAYLPEQSVTLARFEGYRSGPPPVSVIERPIIKDAATRLNKFRAGDLDLLTVERQDLPAIEKDSALAPMLVQSPRPAVYYLGMNPRTVSAFADAEVRRHVAMAIDRTRICEELLDGVPEARGMLPPGILGHRPDYPGLAADPAAARRFFTEKKVPPFTLAIREQRPDARIVAEAVASDLNRAGLVVSIRTMEWRAFLEARSKGQLEMWFGSWFADYPDPENFLSFLLRTGAQQNYDGWSDPSFDQTVDRADAAQDPQVRAGLYQAAEDRAIQQAARIPLYFQEDSMLVAPRVKDTRQNAMGMLPHATTRIVKQP